MKMKADYCGNLGIVYLPSLIVSVAIMKHPFVKFLFKQFSNIIQVMR